MLKSIIFDELYDGGLASTLLEANITHGKSVKINYELLPSHVIDAIYKESIKQGIKPQMVDATLKAKKGGQD